MCMYLSLYQMNDGELSMKIRAYLVDIIYCKENEGLLIFDLLIADA